MGQWKLLRGNTHVAVLPEHLAVGQHEAAGGPHPEVGGEAVGVDQHRVLRAGHPVQPAPGAAMAGGDQHRTGSV